MNQAYTVPENWLPGNKTAAVCFTIDDIHPGKSTDHFEAGGDMEHGALGLVQSLLDRVPDLRVTLFTTASWRESTPVPTFKTLASIPYLRDNFHLAKRLKKNSMSLTRHPAFISYLNHEERFECAFHGLYHVHKGLKIPVEFQNQTEKEFLYILREMKRIFKESGLNYSNGLCPPGWNAPDNLLRLMKKEGFDYVASSRDVKSPISKNQLGEMSGLTGLPLLQPCILSYDGLIHYPTNFQATSTYERARDIIASGGLLSIKAHIVKNVGKYVALDGVDKEYMDFLVDLCSKLKAEFGEKIWWTSMGEMTKQINNT